MSLFTGLSQDLRDIISCEAFKPDFTDTTLPLLMKLKGSRTLGVVLGYKYVKFSVISSSGKDIYVEVAETLTPPETAASIADIADWFFKSSELATFLAEHRLREVIVGYYPESLDSVIALVEPKVDHLPYLKDFSSINNSVPEFPSNAVAVLNAISQPVRDDVHYSYAVNSKMNRGIILTQPKPSVVSILRSVELAELKLVKLVCMPTAFFNAGLEEGQIDAKPNGCGFIYVNKVLIGFGWTENNDTKSTFLKSRRVFEDKGGEVRSPKDTNLGRQVQDVLRGWISRSGQAQSFNPKTICIVWCELPNEHTDLDLTMREVIPTLAPQSKRLTLEKLQLLKSATTKTQHGDRELLALCA